MATNPTADACNKAKTANGVSDGIDEAAHEAPKAAPKKVAAAVPTDNGANGVSEAAHEAPKAALKKVANAAPNNKCVSEGIDEYAYEALKAAHARPQYRTYVKNIGEAFNFQQPVAEMH
ncbi:hypothetical protein M885DRAFT_574098 [Pelagophyceae sp. CCMP2097]|nr:hypothetical protein M885DRAFT_574098 [Pelagophyceae sp. CCMP2097]